MNSVLRNLKLEWSSQSKIDLLEIVRYVGEDKPEIAERLSLEINEKVELLREFPFLGKKILIKGFAKRELRQLIFYRWLIIYKVKNDVVAILRILDGSQNAIKRLKSLRK